MTIVVLSPHQDDAAFSVSLAIDAWLDSGHHVAIVNCFTRSEYAPFANCGITPSNADSVMALRKGEDHTWQEQFSPGLTLTELGIADAPLRLGCSAADVCRLPNPGDRASLEICNRLHEMQADALALPLAIGDHVDHQAARAAAIGKVSSATPCAFYEDLPYAARPGAAQKIEQTALAIHGELAPVFAGRRVRLDRSRQRKYALAKCYPTQIDDEMAGQIADFCVRYGGRERLWANAAWQASELTSHHTGHCSTTL